MTQISEKRFAQCRMQMARHIDGILHSTEIFIYSKTTFTSYKYLNIFPAMISNF